ncbi:DNA mismatch repair protein MutL [Flavobacterium longum]|uniref:DNA mismatch repair endonuclease MutL n=1 Tax=Flavobacterium longum TaxID=1299340 RepID=UPI0039ED73D5
MSGIIQLLPDHVANQIAAGEVVQRPASVVKELMENAVDAKATEITLNIKDAGKTLIQVIDNGVGMNAFDARLCFARHATSKIRQAEDLFDLHTKGFRGEALASIAAIAHVELKTRQAQDELGQCIVIEGSKFISEEMAVVPKGTSFAIKNLFFNIPARRNFLKSDVVELRHIIDEFQRVAMAHPAIHFQLYHNNSEVFNLPSQNLRQRISGIFGGKTNEKLVPISEETDIVTIQGFVTKPEFAKKTRGEQFFFVNNRFIKSGYLHHAIMSAYEGLLKDGCQPGYFIYLSVPPQSIDINIHPTKTEIKFDDEHALYAYLRSSVKHSLGQFNVAPVLDFERDANLDTPYDYQYKQAVLPTVEVDGAFNPFGDTKPSKTYTGQKKADAAWESLYVGLKQDTDAVFADTLVADPSANEWQQMSGMKFESEAVTSSLFESQDESASVSKTYQLHKKYIVSFIKSGMVIIDQQRAHQRVLYEGFLTSMTVHQAASQQLLFPLELYFSSVELALLEELRPSLVSAGFVFGEAFEDRIVVSGVPVNVTGSEVSIVIEELLADLQQGIPGNSFSQSDSIAKSMARSLAVKTGTYLTETEQENLLDGLFACKEPDVSPFGKPTFLTMRVEDLDKKFSV